MVGPEQLKFFSVSSVVEGVIFFTHSKVIQPNGKEFPTITFSPVCISPKYQRQRFYR